MLYGRTINWLLSRRTIPSFNSADLGLTSTDAESISRWVIEQAFDDVANFIHGDVVGFATQESFWRQVTNPVFEVVRDCLELAGAGHEVFFDFQAKKMGF